MWGPMIPDSKFARFVLFMLFVIYIPINAVFSIKKYFRRKGADNESK